MPAANEFSEVPSPKRGTWTLALWHAYDPVSTAELHSTAVIIEGGGIYFIDPIPLDSEAMGELLDQADVRPAGVLVTSGNHARAAAEFGRRFGVPVAATGAAAEAASLKLDEEIPASGGPIFDGAFEAVPLTGAAVGEVAYYRPDGGGLMVFGDALVDFGGSGLMLLPEKYQEDPQAFRESLAKLVELPFATLTVAHGDPIVGGADARVRGLLEA